MTEASFLTCFVAAFLTLAIATFLYKDNPVYKFAEHIFVGVAAGYYVVVAYKQTLIPRFWNHAQADEPLAWVRIGAGILGILLLLQIWPRMSWLARWPIAFLVGSYAGLRLVSAMQTDVIGQVDSLTRPVWREGMPAFALRGESVIGNVLIVAGVVSVLIHFFFSAERGPAMRAISRVAILFLMITFGAAFGVTVTGRVSILIGRARSLQSYGWATIAAAALVAALIALWEVRRRRRESDGETPEQM